MSDESTRDRIYACLRSEGAVHKSELCRRVGCGWGTVSHHLHELQRRGLVELESDGRLTWAYLAELTERQRLRSKALNAPGRRDLLQALGEGTDTVTALSQELEASRKVVRNHLAHLMDAGLVERGTSSPARYRLLRFLRRD